MSDDFFYEFYNNDATIFSSKFQGVDSLSTAITFFVLTISMHENCRKTLTKEIDDFVNENGDVLDLQKVENLLYLKYCYKETLRLFPYSALLTKISNNDVVIKESMKKIIFILNTFYFILFF